MTQAIEKALPVEAAGLTKIYGTGTNRVTALADVSLTVQRGEFLAIMGASGSGKSTLLHLLAGLTERSSGEVRINGVDMANMSDAERTRFRRRNIGIVFQAFNLIPTLTAEENILLPSLIEGTEQQAREKLETLLETLELRDRRRHRPDSLSGGEQQRVAIARALMMQPALVLADEPTGNLDSDNSERLCKILRTLCDEQQRTIVLVTHDAHVASYGDRCITLKDGRIIGENREGDA